MKILHASLKLYVNFTVLVCRKKRFDVSISRIDFNDNGYICANVGYILSTNKYIINKH